MTKKTIGVMFGGISAEHEISIITALQAITAIDTLIYDIVPIYIDQKGHWYTGEVLLHKQFYRNLSDNLSQAQRVILLPDPTIQGLARFDLDGKIDLNNLISIDVYFLAFHGQYGEDGCVQGLLELAGASYTGCGVTASAVAMDKYQCKMFLKAHEIPVIPGVCIRRKEILSDLKKVQHTIAAAFKEEPYPLFVKPCHLGSSVGVSIAHDLPTLNASLAKAFRFDDAVIVERAVTEILEINISILNGRPSVVEVPIATKNVLTFEDKYLKGGKKGSNNQGMASLARVIDPADLAPSIKEEVTKIALNSYALLDCSGVVRFDFIYDLKAQKLYFNELNPIPGSLSFYLWEKTKPRILYTDIIEELIAHAEKHKGDKFCLEKNLSFKCLS